eukprot:TRINITY_DN110789_c0_g1_i1.p1 TRINITY_DN110789_c0_g1~~TRINITY_DN110789_c0_g1_i1.p1  ORF type:complete len:868 (-),score=173.06 TRINITY_DN110789_c0_g1_i1:46-2559(-)
MTAAAYGKRASGVLARRPSWTQPGIALGACRAIHKGHVNATLEKLDLPRHHWLKEVDQAPEKSSIRRMKDKYLKELGLVHKDMQGLFRDGEDKAIKEATKEELKEQKDAAQRREVANEAMRMYRLLRPDAPPFYEEDAMFGMKAKMNKIHLDEAPEDADASALIERGTKYGDPFKAYLPVVNQRAFLLALESIVSSLADDVETMCLLAGLSADELPSVQDPLRFKKLVDLLFGSFPLEKDPSRVRGFMQHHWPRLRALLPVEVAELDEAVVTNWLEGHLQRVRVNQRRAEERDQKIFLHKKLSEERFYNFSEDFPYDDDPMPGLLADERNLDFPLENAKEYMQHFLGALSSSPRAAEIRETAPGAFAGPEDTKTVASQFQDFIWDLESIGLRNWLKMDTSELQQFLPKGELAQLVIGEGRSGKGVINLSDEDVEVAKLMLKCAARGKADLLDFEAVDPYKLLHGLPAKEVDEELATLRPNDYLGDDTLSRLVESHKSRLEGGTRSSQKPTDSEWLSEGATVDELYKKELDFYRSAGPVEWMPNEDGGYTWKWRQPPNTFWDERRKVYIQEQKGVNPELQLKEMRQHMLDVTRMGSMVKVGRINYFRALVVVGNGKGVYGFGVGFGNTPKEARADSSLKALQNLEYIDMDPGRMLTTPVKGHEYKHTMEIIPRPIGRGIRANKKFLPLLYILGLDNCKVRFMYPKWFTRIRAIKRALDGITSRRTLANMTGKRYSLLVAPGDHWVHWPDRWFQEIRQPYDARYHSAKLARKHAVHFKKRGRVEAVSANVKPGWRKKNWIRWNNPLERWLQHRRENYDPEGVVDVRPPKKDDALGLHTK